MPATGDTVHVHYTGRLDDGSEFDSSRGRDPLTFTIGAGQVIGGFDTAVAALSDGRRGRNIRHRLAALLRQSVLGRLAGYEDVNDAERLARDPAMRAIVGREGLDRLAASRSRRIKLARVSGGLWCIIRLFRVGSSQLDSADPPNLAR